MKKKRDSYSYSSFSELYPNEGFYPMSKNVCFSATKQILTSLIFVFRIYPVKGFGFLRSQVMRKFRFKTFLFQFLEFLSSQTRTLLVLIFFSEFLNATQQGYFFSPFRIIAHFKRQDSGVKDDPNQWHCEIEILLIPSIHTKMLCKSNCKR